MTEPNANQRRGPRLYIDPDAIASRLETLDDAVLCARCRDAVVPVATDTVSLLIEAIRLWDALCAARLESANRLAAMCAVLRAAAECEPDPLAYLRDEIDDNDPGAAGEWCR